MLVRHVLVTSIMGKTTGGYRVPRLGRALAWGTQELSAENAKVLWNCVCHHALQEAQRTVSLHRAH